MTLTDLANLTPEQKRVKIAEACGWERWESPSGIVQLLKPSSEQRAYWIDVGCKITTKVINKETASLPSYLSDLNAMHEAEKTLNKLQQLKYAFTLCSIVHSAGMSRPMEAEDVTRIAFSTAAQRADAFLLTI